MKKRLLSVVISLCLILSLLPITVFSADAATIAPTKSTVRAGDTFDVSLVIPSNSAKKAYSASFKYYFDNTVFEVVSFTPPTIAGKAANGFNSTLNFISCTYEGDLGENTLDFSSGLSVTAQFKVKDGAAPGTYNFTVDKDHTFALELDLTDFTTEYPLFSVPSGLKTTVKVLKSAASITINDPGAIVYDGNPVEVGSGKDLNYTYTGDGAVTVKWYADNSGDVGTELPGAPKDAGTWWIGVSAAEGTGSDAVAEQTRRFTIGRADYNYTRPATDAASIGAALPAAAPATADGVLSETVNGELTWYTDDACTAMATGNFDTLGTKDLWWKFTPDAAETNYKTAPKSGKVTYTVTALPMQDVSFADAGPIAKTFGDSNFTNAASNATAGGGAITYSGNNDAVATVNASTGEVTIVGAGTVTVTATAAATATHSKTTASYVLNVSAMTVVPNVTLAAGPFYYDGNPKTPAVTVDVSGVALVLDKDYTVRYEGNTAVGTSAKAIVTAKDGSNYTWTPAVEKTFAIDKGTLDMSGAAWTTPAAFSYDGNAHTVAVTGLPAHVTVSGYTGNEATYAGSYTAAATLSYDTANYDLSAPLAPYAWSITAVEDPAAIAPAASVFKGKNTDLSGNVSGAMGDVSYSITAPLAGCSVDVATGAFTAGTTPGSCTVTVTVAPKDVDGDGTPEYAGKTGTITVTVQNKNDVSANIAFPDGTLEYTGGALKYENAEISGITPGANPMWTYVYTAGTGTLDGGLPKTVGTYTVQATYDDDDNNGVKTATLTVSPKKITAPAADTTVYTYDGTAKTYKIAASADYSVSGNVETNANETGYTVTVALTDKTNTVWADSMDATDKTHTFIIKRAVPTGEPKYTPITVSGKTLGDAALTDVGGSFSVPGTVQWVADDGVTPLADTTSVVANTDYKWLFKPADAANYTTITGTIRLYKKSLGGGGSLVTRYTIMFESNGGSNVASCEVYRNDTVSEPTAPTKAGYDFDGWYTDKALTEKYDFSTKVKGSFKLYAKWTAKDNTANQIILTIGQKDAIVFGKKVTNDVAPKIVNDRTMLPARFVAENLGATVFWDGDQSLVTIVGKNEKNETVTISFVIGASVATVNGVEVKLDTPAFIENDRTYTPIRFISERLGAKVDWIAAERKAVITRATPAEEK